MLSRTVLINRSARFFANTMLRTTHNDASASKSIYEIRVPTTDLDMFAGYSEVKNRVADIVEYLQDPSAFLKAGINPPKGVLLSGPPGTGKTMLAEAIAGHSGVSVMITTGSAMLHKYVGGTEENLRTTFKVAGDNAPCVLLIDEIDSIAGERFSSPQTSHERLNNSIVNELLTRMSDCPPGVVVIATTNLADSLDAAVTRPGRFDRHIVMSMPAKKDRLEILAQCVKNKNLDAAVKLEDLAAISANFSGAKLTAWINEAAMFALREKSEAITLRHVEMGRSMIQRGALGTPHSGEQKIRIAQHEIGHALVGHLTGSQLYKVSILNAGTWGLTEFISDDNLATKQEIMNDIMIAVAGRAAELLCGNSEVGSGGDLQRAKKWATYLVHNEGLGSALSGVNVYADVESLLQESMVRALDLLKKNEADFHKLVAALTHEGELFGKDFRDVLNGTYTPSVASHSKPDREGNSILPKKKNHIKPQQQASSVMTMMPGFFNNTQKQNLDEYKAMGLFTINTIATAIGVEPNLIRTAQLYPGGYKIQFIPGGIEHDYITQILAPKFTNNTIDYDYDDVCELCIPENSFPAFIDFVNNANKPGFSPGGV